MQSTFTLGVLPHDNVRLVTDLLSLAICATCTDRLRRTLLPSKVPLDCSGRKSRLVAVVLDTQAEVTDILSLSISATATTVVPRPSTLVSCPTTRSGSSMVRARFHVSVEK
ncbi:hypothetical protein OH76DRAFT_1408496 [Lentinus brumalis]|uniref:Uncharacterized protein n=1 Tax=Lentinus brumalis TaxID=2498619 RepID=A0A371CXN6_9APHY|nr:hypothetical protein OH76DRAFT_1408496 [Polyporus brumalis]